MDKVNVNLIDNDCWESIFQTLRDHNYDLASVSLACKRFLLITDGAKVSLKVSYLTLDLLPRILQRFQNLKSIEFRLDYPTEPDRTIVPVLQSDLQHLESLKCVSKYPFPLHPLGKGFRILDIKNKGLKRLDLSGLYYLCDDNLIELKDLFPRLEDLNITGRNMQGDLQITDDGIEALSLKLDRLKKITLESCAKITYKSIMFLSSNCLDLMDVTIVSCRLVTGNGVGFLMRHSLQLNSLSLFCGASFWNMESEFTFKNSISYAKNLEHLEVYCQTASDENEFINELSLEVLYAIAKASPPLKSFHYNNENVVIDGLLMVLRSCPSLKEFFTEAYGLADSSVLEISKYLGRLTHIKLYSFGSAAFFTLINNCPFLESINMECSTVGDVENIDDHLHLNYQMKQLYLSYCSQMNDETLIRFVSVCPNLEFLTLSYCDITNEGIAEVLRLCPKLTHLDVSSLEVSNFVGQSEDGKLKLTSVIAHNTRINDEALEVMDKRCPDLEELKSQGCKNVTNDGVKELISKCEKLRKINVNECRNVSVYLLACVMNLRPLLKQNVPSLPSVKTGGERNVFLCNGRMVSIDLLRVLCT